MRLCAPSQVRYNQKNGGHLKNGCDMGASPASAKLSVFRRRRTAVDRTRRGQWTPDSKGAMRARRRGDASVFPLAGGWFYPQAEVRTTVSLPQLGLCDDDGPDGVKNQGNQQGEWFWCDSRMEIS